MVEIERLKIQKFKNGIEICNNVEELSESLKTNIKILKEVLSDEGIECRFEKHNENILIKNFNFNNNTIKHIVIRMLVFQNNVFNKNGDLQKFIKTAFEKKHKINNSLY